MNSTSVLDIIFPPNVDRAAIPFIVFVAIIVFIVLCAFAYEIFAKICYRYERDNSVRPSLTQIETQK